MPNIGWKDHKSTKRKGKNYLLKAERIANGETRSEADRRRAQANKE